MGYVSSPKGKSPSFPPGRFPKKKQKGYEKMAPCNGCTQMPSFNSQCTMKLGALGGCSGVPGVFFAFPWKSLSLPRNSREKVVQRLKMNWWSLFFLRWCFQIYYLFSLLFGRNDPFWSMWQFVVSNSPPRMLMGNLKQWFLEVWNVGKRGLVVAVAICNMWPCGT